MEHEVRILRESVQRSPKRLFDLCDEYRQRENKKIRDGIFLHKILYDQEFAESVTLNVIANQKAKV